MAINEISTVDAPKEFIAQNTTVLWAPMQLPEITIATQSLLKTGLLNASQVDDFPMVRFASEFPLSLSKSCEQYTIFTEIDNIVNIQSRAVRQLMQNEQQTTTEHAKLTRKEYEKELRKLQIELCRLQEWVKHKGVRVVIVFEGRDGAGKGGAIKAITERVSPRVFRVVALPAPSDREKTQIYLQRYMQHFPAGGEIVIFDRSWYNRPGVEYVMGFCSKEQHKRFLDVCPSVEKYIVQTGIQLIKYWLEVGNDEQKRRFEARIEDPVRQWKLSTMDLPSRSKWYEYSRARDQMLEATDVEHAPWHIVRSDDKRRARLNLITHLLSLIPYKEVPHEKVELPQRSKKYAYDDVASIANRRFVPEKY